MNNNILDMHRFGKYLVSDIKNTVVRTGISFSVIAALPLVLYIFSILFALVFGTNAGTTMAVRVPMFFIALFALVLTFPAAAYGNVTDKKIGSMWLLVPASSFEKTASMLIVSCILAPLAFLVIYLSIDGIICLADSRCGDALLSTAGQINQLLSKEEIPLQFTSALSALANPLLYVDDLIQSILVFLLGAICFKRNKVAKTLFTVLAASMVLSSVVTPIMMHTIGETSIHSAEQLLEHFGWIINHLALVDTINDTVINLALATAIFFRIKTLKH